MKRTIVRLLRPIQNRLHRLLLARGATQLEANHLEKARRSAAWAVKVRSTRPEGWYLLALALAGMSDHQAAVDACDEVLVRNPIHADAAVLRAEELHRAGLKAEALSAWYDLLPTHTGLAPAALRQTLGDMLASDGRWDELLTLARARNEGDLPVPELSALETLERWDEMWVLMVKAGHELPSDLRARTWYTLNRREKRLTRAWWWLQQLPADQLEPEELLDLAELLHESGERRAATECVDLTLELVRPSSEFSDEERSVLTKGARVSLALGLPAHAEVFARKLVNSVPAHPWYWLWLGRTLRAGGDLAGAQKAVESSLDRQEDLLPAWDELAGILKGRGDSDGVLKASRRIVELATDRPGLAIKAVLNLVELGDRERGNRSIASLVEAFPADPDVLVARYQVLDALGEDAEADAWTHQMESRPDVPGMAAAFRILLIRERFTEAAKRIFELPAEAVRPTDAFELASKVRNSGELTQALSILEHAHSQHQDTQLERLLAATKDELNTLTGDSTPSVRRRGHMTPIPGRVLHLVGKSVPHFSSGYTIRTKYLIEAQRQAGIDAMVLTEPGFPWSVGVKTAVMEEVMDGVTYLRCLLPENGDTQIDRMADIVRRVRPAVLHAASDFRNAVNALALGEAFGLPVIYEVRGIWEETWISKRGEHAREREHYRLRRQRETECALAADEVVTLSETLKAELLSRGVDTNRITVVPNAVNTDRFPVQTRNQELASRWGIAPGEVTVGYISSLVAYEGIEFLIAAIAELRERDRPVRGLIVGDGEERPSLEQYACELGVENVVTFTGHVPHDEILLYYGLIDVFVVPRTSARVSQLVTPLKPYEAMATGRAIVVSGVDALREVVKEGETGLVFEPENASDLAKQLDRLLSDDQLSDRLAGNAAAAVRRRHTWFVNAEKYLQLYQRIGVL